MELDEYELFYLRRVVMLRLENLNHLLEKNRRHFRDTSDEILYQKKIANLEVEVLCLEHIRQMINVAIARREFNTVNHVVDSNYS